MCTKSPIKAAIYAACIFAYSIAVHAETRYEAINLETLIGHPLVSVKDINNFGQIVGSFEANTGEQRAFFYDGEAMHDLGDLLEPPYHARSEGVGVNDRGQVILNAWTTENPTNSRAFFYDGYTLRELTKLLDTYNVVGINNQLQVIGNAPRVPFVLDVSKRLMMEIPNGARIPIDINEHGQVVGRSVWNAPNVTEIFSGFLYTNGEVTHLPDWASSEATFVSAITGINDTGYYILNYDDGVYGSALLVKIDQSESVFLQTAAFDNPDFGAWDHAAVFARDINNKNQIVGYYEYVDEDDRVVGALLWNANEQSSFLTELAEFSTELPFEDAWKINERGQILAGTSLLGNSPPQGERFYLLNPIDLPSYEVPPETRYISSTDSQETVYVNGVKRGGSANWTEATVYKGLLWPGDNVWAIKAEDPPNSGAFRAAHFAEIWVEDERLAYTGEGVGWGGADPRWRCSTEVPEGDAWTTVDFDDSSWAPCTANVLVTNSPWADTGYLFPGGTRVIWTVNLADSYQCGAPEINLDEDSGVYLYQDCLTDLWSLRATAGGSRRAQTYSGSIQVLDNSYTFEPRFTAIEPYSIERGDSVDIGLTRTDFQFTIWSGNEDGVDFAFPGGAGMSVYLEDGATSVRVGRDAIPVPLDGGSRVILADAEADDPNKDEVVYMRVHVQGPDLP